MSTIVSLEIVCNLLLRILLGHYDEYNNQRHWEQYDFMLDCIPSFFTSLRRLDISVHPTDVFSLEEDHRNKRIIETHEKMLLEPLDALKSRYGPQLAHFSFAVPESHYRRLMERAVVRGTRNESVENGHHPFCRYWRKIEGENEPDNAPSSGYWIRQGVDNTSTNAVSPNLFENFA